MKMMRSLVTLFLSFCIFTITVHAAATIPDTTVWFTPSDAAVGNTVTLNALVYNNQTQTATVTVSFATDKETVGAVTEDVAPQSAKTFMKSWIMPSVPTLVTATVTSAVNIKKQSIPALLGKVGSVSVGQTVTPTISSSSFPGSSQINAWFAPLLTHIKAFRVKEATYYSDLRDKTKVAIGITPSKSTPNATNDYSLPQIKLDNPLSYVTLVYATALAAFFSSQAIFYIAGVLIVLLVLRFVVNLIF